MRYRKKPIEVEAIQLGVSSIDRILHWCPHSRTVEPFGVEMEISTMEGVMRAQEGDYIIRGIKGEFYPCKPDIFEATYEVCDD